MKKDDPKWLETIVAVDDSVIQFHGSKTVKRYILTLLNIVSAIYGDPTLGADLKFVILRLIFFEGSASFNPIDQSDSKQSLENVNRYIIYRTRAIISRGLYIFYHISKNHFFVFKEVFSENFVLMYGLYSRAAYNQERLMMARVR